MDASQEFVDFTVKLAISAANLQSGDVETTDLRCEEEQVIKIGRATKSDVPVTSPGVSWVHTEMRVQRKPGAEGQLQLVIRDISSNGTGLQLPGQTLERLPKGQDTPVADGSMVAFPMKMKSPDDQRFLTVHLTTNVEGAQEQAKVEDLTAEAVAGQGAGPFEIVELEESPVALATGAGASKSSHADSVESKNAELPNDVAAETSPERNATREARDDAATPAPDDEPHATSADLEPDPEPDAKRARKALPMPKPAAALPDGGLSSELPPARPPSGPPGTRPPPRGARPKGAAVAPRAAASSDVPAVLREKIIAGEGIIRDAREAEDRNQWGQAFDCYQRGLANFMEVLPKLGKDSPGGISLRQQINGYLTRAGELKEKLERSKAFGCNKVVRPRRG